MQKLTRSFVVIGMLTAAVLVSGTCDLVAGKKTKFKSKQLRKNSKVDTKWEKRADKNEDGRVGRKEAKQAKETYLEKRSEVDKKWEEKADRNDDGSVDSKELTKWRNYKKRKVNTAVEKKYDADGDGWVSKDEAKEMLKDRKSRRKANNADSDE